MDTSDTFHPELKDNKPAIFDSPPLLDFFAKLFLLCACVRRPDIHIHRRRGGEEGRYLPTPPGVDVDVNVARVRGCVREGKNLF